MLSFSTTKHKKQLLSYVAIMKKVKKKGSLKNIWYLFEELNIPLNFYLIVFSEKPTNPT